MKDWRADLRPKGVWSVCVALSDGRRVDEWGEICAVEAPNRIVLTRHFGGDPLIGERETTRAYQLEPSPYGTLITVREDGFLGRPQAAHVAADNWEQNFGCLDSLFERRLDPHRSRRRNSAADNGRRHRRVVGREEALTWRIARRRGGNGAR